MSFTLAVLGEHVGPARHGLVLNNVAPELPLSALLAEHIQPLLALGGYTGRVLPAATPYADAPTLDARQSLRSLGIARTQLLYLRPAAADAAAAAATASAAATAEPTAGALLSTCITASLSLL